MISIGQGKLRILCAKLCAFGSKTKKILQVFNKLLRFFDQNLDGKLTFTFLLNIYLISDSSPKVDTSEGEGTFRRPPPPTFLASAMNEIPITFEMLHLFELNHSSIYDNHNENIV